MTQANAVSIDRRARYLGYLLLILAALAGVRLVYLATLARGELLNWGENIAWRRGVLLPLRGQIYDSQGDLLAESIRYFDLELTYSGRLDLDEYRILVEQIRQVVPLVEEEGVFTAKGLSPDQLARLAPLRRNYLHSEFRVRSRQERIYYGGDDLRKALGEVRSGGDGIPHGVSGIEAIYDEKLTGKSGSFRIGKDGRSETFELEVAPEPGEEVFLSLSRADLLKNAETDDE